VILRSADRFSSAYDGIESRHCFSAGAHYDPDNVAFGALVAVDEHVVAPGAGFDWHAHDGVDIVSWVRSGVLRHEDDRGADRLIEAGDIFTQSAADGIRHRETNPSQDSPLQLVQMAVLSGQAARFELWTTSGRASSARWHVFVGAGTWHVLDATLEQGDSMRSDGTLAVEGDGALLVWLL
jgi:redox-sensitive bicupin YhaK (pirin superfamily)